MTAPLVYPRGARVMQAIEKFLRDNENRVFDSLPELYAEAANAARCSTVTASRWIMYLSRPKGPFFIWETQAWFIRSKGETV